MMSSAQQVDMAHIFGRAPLHQRERAAAFRHLRPSAAARQHTRWRATDTTPLFRPDCISPPSKKFPADYSAELYFTLYAGSIETSLMSRPPHCFSASDSAMMSAFRRGAARGRPLAIDYNYIPRCQMLFPNIRIPFDALDTAHTPPR